MKLQEFDYILPKELIAQSPERQRDSSRLMVLHRKSREIEHTYFHQLPAYLQKEDLLVANDTRVIPARIFGRKETGGWVELFLLNFLENGPGGTQIWECLLKSRKKINVFSNLYFNSSLSGKVLSHVENGIYKVELNYKGDFDKVINEAGITPLPPYIKRDRSDSEEHLDRERYQTVYARSDGAVAAPTAGFHFSRSLIDNLKKKGIDFTFLTLHIGYGTFQPIRDENLNMHKMHKEFYRITESAAKKINEARHLKRRVVAVGTTATRVLETMIQDDGNVQNGEGLTDLYICPGHTFTSIDALITNFHLPRSSLLIMVSAFAGKDFILKAYNEAVEKKYRFFSYGDAMLIV